jgi:hypothetical protein
MLRSSEFSGGIALLQLAKQGLCLFFEMVEIRDLGQMARHFSSFVTRRPLTGKEG